jgi:hypothetical protein
MAPVVKNDWMSGMVSEQSFLKAKHFTRLSLGSCGGVGLFDL